MPYIKIMEEDINPLASFDTVENAVLVFGLDYRYSNMPGQEYDGFELIKDFKLFTSLRDFYSYISVNHTKILTGGLGPNTRLSTPGYRSFVTAYDCLASGLPVIYLPIDKYFESNDDLNSRVLIELETQDSDGNWTPTGVKIIRYDWLSNPGAIPENKPEDLSIDPSKWADIRNNYLGPDGNQNFIGEALNILISEKDENNLYVVRLGDRVNMPFTFITTCGFDTPELSSQIIDSCSTTAFNDASGIKRQDFLYLYDIMPNITPAQVISNNANAPTHSMNLAENLAMIYPWGTYTSNVGSGTIHMPGSYGYLMAYANSIKSNKPWFAIAGINRGRIPNIVNVDYDISEPYIHAMQGDPGIDNNMQYRVNPIVKFGYNMGTIIFGNRTNFIPSTPNSISFRSFLNIRLLLIFLHKQAYIASVQHMFEPNDDIVWLSFKQKVNELLEQMVSGRGIKWYKWFKLQPDRLGQIKARILIRPIEAVEAFEITISMTDSDISVTVQGE